MLHEFKELIKNSPILFAAIAIVIFLTFALFIVWLFKVKIPECRAMIESDEKKRLRDKIETGRLFEDESDLMIDDFYKY